MAAYTDDELDEMGAEWWSERAYPHADVPPELAPLAETLDQIPALRAKLRAAAEDMARISRLCAILAAREAG